MTALRLLRGFRAKQKQQSDELTEQIVQMLCDQMHSLPVSGNTVRCGALRLEFMSFGAFFQLRQDGVQICQDITDSQKQRLEAAFQRRLRCDAVSDIQSASDDSDG